MKPKLTIITPSFNQGQFIEQTINSVLGQNYDNLEYFIVDGGSSDETLQVLEKYKNQIDWWVSEKDGGQTHAINKCLLRSTGDIITWVNSDDILEPGALEYVSQAFNSAPTMDMLHGNSILFGEGLKAKTIGGHHAFNTAVYISSIPFPQPSFYFRRRVIENCGLLDSSHNFGMDYELLARAILAGHTIEHTNKVLSRYRIHSNSKSADFSQFCSDWSRTFSKVLKSVPGTSYETDIMKQCGLWKEPNDVFLNQITLSDVEKSDALVHHLNVLCHIYYQSNKSQISRRIIYAIKRYNHRFYKEHRLFNLLLRTLAPRLLIQVARNLRNLLYT